MCCVDQLKPPPTTDIPLQRNSDRFRQPMPLGAAPFSETCTVSVLAPCVQWANGSEPSKRLPFGSMTTKLHALPPATTQSGGRNYLKTWRVFPVNNNV